MDCSTCICISKLLGDGKQEDWTLPFPGVAHQAERPEKINWFLVLEMFFANAASSVGTVGFVWATVVLLGGFVTKLNPVDFWFVTILSFFQAIRIIGGDWNSEKKIISDLLINDDSFMAKCKDENYRKSKTWLFLLSTMDKLTSAVAHYSPKGLDYSTLLPLGRYLCKISAFIVRLLRFIVPMVWVALSFPHLILQNFGDIGRSAEDMNMKAALNLYYGLAVGQAVLSIIAVNYSFSRSKLLEDVANEYGINDSGNKTMDLYYRHVRRICRDEGIVKTLNMTLIAFAVKSLASNDKEAHQAGVTILHDLVKVQGSSTCSTEALLSIRDCQDAIESLSNMIASTSDSEDEMPKREMAALVMAKLAIYLHVPQIPSVLRSVWSLLETRDGEVVTSDAIYVKFTHKGLEILEQLSRHACNLSVISSSHELMAKLTGFTYVPELSHAIGFRKARRALTVFSRLASCTGVQGINLRQDILENAMLLSNIGEILQSSSLREEAIGIIDGFALDAASRDCGATRKLVMMLLGVFCSLDAGNNDVQVQLAAGRTLARLTTESQANCHAIIRKEGVLEVFSTMLSGQHGTSRRVVVANILKNLCAYAKPGSNCQESMRAFSENNMSMALTTMYQTDNRIGEDMEAFLGLVLQSSKLLPVATFSMAVNENGIDLRNFVEKLKLILNQANSDRTSTSRHPGIRRFAIEQAIWMAQSEPQLPCINHFIDCEMRDDLVMAQQTARRVWQENFKLSSGNVPVLEYEESLRCVATRALELIPEEQINGQ